MSREERHRRAVDRLHNHLGHDYHEDCSACRIARSEGDESWYNPPPPVGSVEESCVEDARWERDEEPREAGDE